MRASQWPARTAASRHSARSKLQVTGQHAMHDLTGIEHHGLAARLAEVPGKCTVGTLQGEFPVDDAPGTIEQIGTIEHLGRRNERLDDVATGFRIARQPAVFEAPSCRNPAGVGHAVAHVLGEAQPVDRGAEMIAHEGIQVASTGQRDRARSGARGAGATVGSETVRPEALSRFIVARPSGSCLRGFERWRCRSRDRAAAARG